MQSEIEEIISLQRQFSAKNTPAMQRRGDLIRRALPAELAIASARLARALGPHGADLNFEGRDGTGMKTYVPWVRFFSRAKTKSAQDGWYCVYLFEATGKGVYLALAHGSTTFEGGEFKPKPAKQLVELVAWGRGQLRAVIAETPDLASPMLLGGRTLGDAYERSTVLAKWYPVGTVPDDNQLYTDAEHFAGLLRRIYDGETLGRAPQTLPPEAVAVERVAAGPAKRTGAQGFGLSATERRAVELQAMALAKQHLLQHGWRVTDVSADHPYDFHCRRKRDEMIVEVKGTTAIGEQILMTHGEVAAHRKHYPSNALIVVHSIDLDRSPAGPVATGGECFMVSPWLIEDAHLTPIAFTCQVSRP